MDGLRSGEDAFFRTVTQAKLVDEIPGQGSLEGCHRMFAVAHLIYRLESMC